MNKAKFYESEIESIVIEMLEEEGWTYTYGQDLHRKETEAVFPLHSQSGLGDHQ